ncbi:MAG: hypothetical protein WCP28_12855, partial [Actinomycetes bacterium]
PGELPGYGPVPASVARALAADGTWVRWVTDPTTGALLDAGRRTYRPSVALREFIKARDVYCRFPGCSARADGAITELDHADPFHHPDPDVGPGTTRQNLGPVCRKHHAIKTAGLWSITDSQPDGTCDWTSPTGHKYPHHPEHLTDIASQPDSHVDDHPAGRFDPVSPDDGTGLPGEPFADDPFVVEHRSGLSGHDPVDLFPAPPPEQRAGDHLVDHPWTDDHSPGPWWLDEPVDLDPPDPTPDADGLRSLRQFTSLEHQLHHALCA